jgi:dolichol-phosphate mannosyltransferase
VTVSLVTGASGFVGANLARRLLEDGDRVHLLLRADGATWRVDELGPDAERHPVDLLDGPEVARLVDRVRPDRIFHLAAHGAYSWQRDPRLIATTNILGLVNLLEAAVATGVEAVVSAGSSSEYGIKDHAALEDEPPEPNSHYAVSKAAASLYCGFYARERGLRALTLRLYSVYGPYEEPNRLVPAIVTHALRGALPPLADPSTARDYVYVDDAVEAFLAAAGPAGAPGAIYNVGTGRQTTLAEIVAVARRALGVTAEPVWGSMAGRDWDTAVWVSDPGRAARELGWSARVDLEEGLRRTSRWLEERPRLRAFYEESLLAGRRATAR